MKETPVIVEVPTERVSVGSPPSARLTVPSVEEAEGRGFPLDSPRRDQEGGTTPAAPIFVKERRNPFAQWFHAFKKGWKHYLYLTVNMLLAWPTGFFLYLVGVVAVAALWLIAAFVDNWAIGGLLIGLITIPLGAFLISWFVRAARGYVGMYRAVDRKIAASDIATPAPFGQTGYFRDSLKARINGESNWRGPARGFWQSFASRMSDVTAWRAVLYMFLNVLTAAFGWALTTLLGLLGIAALAYPLYWHRTGSYFPDGYYPDGSWVSARIPGSFSLGCRSNMITPPSIGPNGEWLADGVWGMPTCRYLAANQPWQIALVALTGLLLLAFLPFIVRGFARLVRKLGIALLGPTKGAFQEAELQNQRAGVVADTDERLRQIERDLHDGTQAQLTAIAMQIGEARELLAEGADPSVAASILATAQQSANEAMTNLRDITSGIRPATLDSGLLVALETLCARSTIPVTLERYGDIDTVDPRVTNWVPVDPAVRYAAYYTVNELLANAAKHSKATQIWLRVARPQTCTPSDELLIQYIDNGQGGARIIPAAERAENGGYGTGLAGLAERLATVGGTISISSPLGPAAGGSLGSTFGRTIILVTLPATLGVKWSNEANAYV